VIGPVVLDQEPNYRLVTSPNSPNSAIDASVPFA
jgi:hypothetical protein